MIRFSSIVYMALFLAGCVGYAYAQTDDASQEQTELTEQTADIDPATTIDELSEPSPPPGEEVMRPTKHGIRLTPGLARFIAKKSIEGLGDLSLTEDQQSRLSDVTARRWMQEGHEHGKEAFEFIEFFFESLMRGQGRIIPEDAQEFAKRVKAAMPALEGFDDSFNEDWRPILNDEQWEKLEQMDQKFQKGIDLFKAKMDEWEKDGITEPANPFIELGQQLDEDFGKQAGETKQAEDNNQIAQTKRARKAAGMARYIVNKQGPTKWARFLYQVQTCFKFDEKQIAQGQEILNEYKKKVAAIRTPEWHKRAQINRMKYDLKETFDDKPLAPWLYHLDCEYKEIMGPIDELGQDFRNEIMALVSDEQRQEVLAELQELGTKNGLSPDEMTPEILHLSKSESVE